MRTKSAQAAMSRLRSSLLIGGGMIMAGSSMVKFLGKAVDLAADVELSVTRLQSLTQGSAEQMAEFTRQTQAAAHATAIFSQKEAAELGVTIEQSTKMSIDSINKTLPAFAMFAEAQQKLHGTSATAAVTAAGQMAKVMGLSPGEMPAFLEKLHRVSAAMPKTAQLPALAREVNRPLAFLGGIGADKKQMEELIELQAQLISMGGKGATFGGRNLLMAMVRTLSPTKGGAEAQKTLGITGLGPDGKFDIATFVKQLSTASLRHPEMSQGEMAGNMKALFGQNALALAMTIAGPKFRQKQTEFQGAEARVDPIQVFVNKFLDTFAGAKTQLITDFASAMAEFGKHLLPVLVPLIHFLDKVVTAATSFMQANPTFTKIILLLTALGAAGLIAGGAIVILSGLVGLLGLMGGPVGAAAVSAIGGFALAVGGIGAVLVVAGFGVSKFIDEMNASNKRMQTITATEVDLLQKITAGHGKYAKALRVFNTQLSGELSFTKNFFKDLADTMNPINWGKGLISAISSFLHNAATGSLAQTDPMQARWQHGGKQMGPPAPSGYHAPGKKGGMVDTPGIYQNQVAGIGLVKIIVNGSGNPKEVADQVVKQLAAVTRQSAKGSGNVEELAYATPFMYT